MLRSVQHLNLALLSSQLPPTCCSAVLYCVHHPFSFPSHSSAVVIHSTIVFARDHCVVPPAFLSSFFFFFSPYTGPCALTGSLPATRRGSGVCVCVCVLDAGVLSCSLAASSIPVSTPSRQLRRHPILPRPNRHPPRLSTSQFCAPPFHSYALAPVLNQALEIPYRVQPALRWIRNSVQALPQWSNRSLP